MKISPNTAAYNPRRTSAGDSLKPGFSSSPLKLMEMTGMCPIAGFFQSTTDKSDVVGGTASATGLTDDNGCLVQVIFSGKQGIHDLSDNDQRWITGIVIYIFQSHVDCLFVVIRKYFNLISGCTECRLKKLKVNW